METLTEDIVVARSLAEDPPQGALDPSEASAAVAAAAAVAHLDHRANVPLTDLHWATQLLIDVIHAPAASEYVESSIYPRGSDRSAATGLPALLAIASDTIDLDLSGIANALNLCARHHFDEVRIAFARATTHVWSAPCRPVRPGTCRHRAALDAVVDSLRDCRLGPFDLRLQRRSRLPLDGPYTESLPMVNADDLYLTRLVPALVAIASAARIDNCVQSEAGSIAGAVFAAHARSADHWARKGYDNRLHKHGVQSLIETAISGTVEPLTMHIELFASNGRALHDLLHQTAVLFTYIDQLRPSLLHIWRTAMTTALDALDNGADVFTERNWSDYAVASLLPAPEIDISDLDPDTTLRMARRRWIDPDSVSDLVLRWIPIARGEPKALDALVGLNRCAATSWRVATGLEWTEKLIGNRYSIIANRSWHITDWLRELRADCTMTPEQLTRWRHIVDGLAAAGDNRAVELQRIDE